MSKLFGWLGRNTTVKRPENLRQNPKPSYKVAENIAMAKEADPVKIAKEYKKELDEYYERKQDKKKEDKKDNLYRGRAPEGEGELIPAKQGKTPIEKYLEKNPPKPPPEPAPKIATLSKLRNKTGRRTAVAGSRCRKLH
jgi:hypothetical protein